MAEIEYFDPDLVAAFIDGKLSGAERERVVKLLAESEAAFEVYSDAVMARSDLQGAGPARVVDGGRRPRRWWIAAVPVAAAAALLIAVLPAAQARRDNALLAMRAESIALPLTGQPRLAGTLGSTLDEGRWSANRGGGSTVVESAAALRLGVRATDLQVALGVGDRERAGRVAGEMVDLLGSVNLSDAARVEYADLRKRIVSDRVIGQTAAAAATADDRLRDLLDSPWYGFGKWFAASDMAARAHSAEFFKSAKTARFLEAAIRSGHFPPDEVESLRQVADIAKRGVADSEFETIHTTFAELIRRHAS